MKPENLLLVLGGAYLLLGRSPSSPQTAQASFTSDSRERVVQSFGQGFANQLESAVASSTTAGEVFAKLGTSSSYVKPATKKMTWLEKLNATPFKKGYDRVIRHRFAVSFPKDIERWTARGRPDVVAQIEEKRAAYGSWLARYDSMLGGGG